MKTRSQSLALRLAAEEHAMEQNRIRYAAKVLRFTHEQMEDELRHPRLLVDEFGRLSARFYRDLEGLIYDLKTIFNKEFWLPNFLVNILKRCIDAPAMREIRERPEIRELFENIWLYNRAYRGRIHI